jgi:hypothetical protein
MLLIDILEYKNSVSSKEYNKKTTSLLNSCEDIDVPISNTLLKLYIEKYSIRCNTLLARKLLGACVELNEFRNHKEKFVACKNGLTSIPKCVVCNKDVNLKPDGFNTTCSIYCNNNNPDAIKKRMASHKLIQEETQAKRIATCQKNYGTDYVFQAEVNREKSKKTLMERYGVEHISQAECVYEKVKASNLEKYGTICTLNDPTIRKKATVSARTRQYLIWQEKFKNDITLKFTLDEYLEMDIRLKSDVLLFNCNKCKHDFNGCLNNGDIPRCYFCYPVHTSKTEEEIKEFFEDRYQLTSTSPKILDGREIDIYFEEIKVGIEFNGIYWHSSEFKSVTYHQDKSLSAKEQGIKLFHIWEDEWPHKKDKIIAYIDSLAGRSQKIYARNTQIKEITYKEAHPFIENTHLKSNTRARIYIGLFHNNILVSCMSFGKPRFRKDSDWEIIRFCSSILVVGGASKIIKYFRNNYVGSIITYADLDYSTGAVYLQCGFKLIDKTEPSYFYVKNGVRYSRQQLQKKKLLKLYPELKDLTGDEILSEKHYFKIYTSGNLVYRLD